MTEVAFLSFPCPNRAPPNRPRNAVGHPRTVAATNQRFFSPGGVRRFFRDSAAAYSLQPSWHGHCLQVVRMNDMNHTFVEVAPGPGDSFEWLVPHADYLFSLAVGQVRDGTAAEDLVQETFLAALKARNSFRRQSSDRTWLVGILRHKIYDHLRRVCRERLVHSDHSSSPPDQEAWDESVLWVHETAAECLEPSRRMELAEFRQALETALGKLPPRIAQVFQLYAVEERSNHEVCDRLGISENNLWVMLHRARKQLRAELAGWWPGKERETQTVSFSA
jgi:RNA polymerase sigma-70 factor (ECF subfamily)